MKTTTEYLEQCQSVFSLDNVDFEGYHSDKIEEVLKDKDLDKCVLSLLEVLKEMDYIKIETCIDGFVGIQSTREGNKFVVFDFKHVT